MNKQRKVLINITYNEMGIINDTKAEEVAQPNLQPTCNNLATPSAEVRTQMSSATDCISRQAAIDALKDMYHAAEKWGEETSDDVIKARAESCMTSLIEMKLRIEKLPSAQPERKKGKWIIHEGQDELCADMICSSCNKRYQVAEISAADIAKKFKFCPSCGADMRGGKDEQA